MPAAQDVVPGRWSETTVLFDDGRYSVVIGLFDGALQIGQRWNGEEGGVGYPNLGGNPLWFVTPKFLATPVLHGVLDELAASNGTGREEMMRRVTDAMLRWAES